MNTEPRRIQRKRTKGWRMPENTVSVTRPGKWGNPLRVIEEDGAHWVIDAEGNYWGCSVGYDSKHDAAEYAVKVCRSWFEGLIESGKLDIMELQGKNLACFCPIGSPCHADVLLEFAKNPHVYDTHASDN